MKKLTKLSALLFVAAVIFAGCKNPDDSTGGVSATPLFSESETTIDINASDIELADGNWVYRAISTNSMRTVVEEFEITVTNGVPKFTKGTISTSGTIPEGTSSEELAKEKAQVEAQGGKVTISGNSFTSTMPATAAILSMMESSFYYEWFYATGLKTNEAKTKFYYSEQKNDKDENGSPLPTLYKYYLMKK